MSKSARAMMRKDLRNAAGLFSAPRQAKAECLCGYKSSGPEDFERHIRGCAKAPEQVSNSGFNGYVEPGGVAAPLEPTPPNVHTSYEEWAAKQNRVPDMLDFAEFHAAAVSKRLREELAERDETIVNINGCWRDCETECEVLRARITALEQELKKALVDKDSQIAVRDELLRFATPEDVAIYRKLRMMAGPAPKVSSREKAADL